MSAGRSVPALQGEAGKFRPLPRSQPPAGSAHADHERVRGLELLPPALGARVPVVLLVQAVELHDLPVRLAQGGGDPAGQAVDDSASRFPLAALIVST